MARTLFVALILCVFSQPLYAGNVAGSDDTYQKEREHWLRSRLKFSGKTTSSTERLDGAISVSVDSLMDQSDAIGFDYRDSKSYRHDIDVHSTSFSYRFGAAGARQLSITAGNSRYDHAFNSEANRYSASGDSREVGLGASQPLFSKFGMAFDGIVRHTGRDNRVMEKGTLVSESDYQLSSLGVKAHGGRDLLAGMRLNSSVMALSGREYTVTDYRLEQDDAGEESGFYKVAFAASVEQDFYQWSWRLDGRYQFADDDLPGSEYMTVAGPSLLAGFNGQAVSVVRGGWLRLATVSPSWAVPFINGVLSSINLAVVQGWIPFSGVQADRYGKASAGQASLRLHGPDFSANLSIGRLIRSSSTAIVMPAHPDVRFSLTMGI